MEIELKLAAEASFEPERLLSALRAVGELSEPQTEVHRDVYFDTPEAKLARAGLAARLRQSAGKRKVDVKAVPLDPGSIMHRAELSRELNPADAPERVVRDFVSELGLSLHQDPQPVVVLDTVRRIHELQWEGARAELALDSVEARTTGTDAMAQFREVEVELLAGDPGALAVVEQAARAVDGLHPGLETKLQRASRLLGLASMRRAPPAPVFDRDASIDEVARLVCARQLEAIVGHEAGTRVGLDPEYLHKMRVATRRLRTALRVFRKSFPASERAAVSADLKWLGALLGGVRDLDVHLLSVTTWKAILGETPREGWEAFCATLECKRSVARAALVEGLDGPRYRALLEGLRALLATEGNGKRAGRAAGELMSRRIRAFRRGLDRFHETRGAEEAHRLRILGKRLRYTAEFMKPVLDEETHELVRKLASFQDALGELQDVNSAGALAAELDPEAPATAGPYRHALGKIVGMAAATRRHMARLVETALVELDTEATLRALAEHATRLADDP